MVVKSEDLIDFPCRIIYIDKIIAVYISRCNILQKSLFLIHDQILTIEVHCFLVCFHRLFIVKTHVDIKILIENDHKVSDFLLPI